MSERRTRLLDAAIELIGNGGVRSLTHRRVDSTAGVPTGSTANYFPTRDRLYAAVVERFVERERANFEAVARTSFPSNPAELARLLGLIACESAGPQRVLTLTRYAILVESAHRPSPLEASLRTGAAGVNRWAAGWLKIVGSEHPERDRQILANYLVGVVLHQLAYPRPDFDPTPQLIELIEALMSGKG